MARRAVLGLSAIVFATFACSASEGGGGQGTGGSGTGASSSGGSGAGTGTGGSSSGGSGATATGGGQIGDACATNDDCKVPADAECWTTIGGGFAPEITFPGGFCSKACGKDGGDGECGPEAGCSTSSVSGGQGSVSLTMCAPPCSKNEDCRVAEGYKCLQLLPGIGVCTL